MLSFFWDGRDRVEKRGLEIKSCHTLLFSVGRQKRSSSMVLYKYNIYYEFGDQIQKYLLDDVILRWMPGWYSVGITKLS